MGHILAGQMLGKRVFDSNDTPYIRKIKALFGSSIIGYWPMNERGGLVAKEASHNIAGMNGIYGGVSVGQIVSDAVATFIAPFFPGTPTWMQFGSPALISAYNGNLHSVMGWLKVFNSSVWTDGQMRDFFLLFGDANNSWFCRKASTNNQFTYNRTAGGTNKTWNKTAITTTDWFHVAFNIDQANDSLVGWFNAINVTPGGKVTGNLAWNASPTTVAEYALLGGSHAGVDQIHNWYGWQAHLLFLNRPAVQSEIISAATP